MKHAIIAVLMVLMLVAGPAALMSTSHDEANASPAVAPIVKCTEVKVSPSQIRIRCTAAGIVVLNQTVNLPTVQLPPLPGETVTIEVPLPGETQTIKVPVPGPTQTVTVPGATVTVTEPGEPGATQTVTEPGETTTITSAPTTPGQDGTTPATIEPSPEDEGDVVVIPEIRVTPGVAVGLGTVAIFVIAGLIVLGMYAGYYLGYKDSDNAEASFYRSLLGK